MAKPGFVGFHPPPMSPDTHMWIDRVQALAYYHPNKWAQYGPYANSNSVYSAKVAAERQSKRVQRDGFILETHVSKDENDRYFYLYIKIRKSDDGVQS